MMMSSVLCAPQELACQSSGAPLGVFEELQILLYVIWFVPRVAMKKQHVLTV